MSIHTRTLALALLILVSAHAALAQEMPADAVVAKTLEYELYYMPQYREDGERAVVLLNGAVAAAKAKYGTTYRGTPCTVNLYPIPNGKASTGSASISTSWSNKDLRSCSVHLLTWSAPEWRTAGGSSSWGDPKDIEYWNAMLVNEYITVLQDMTTVQKPAGFLYYSSPGWFVQGLEAYDGYYHSTEASLARVRGLMRDGRLGVSKSQGYAICCNKSNGGQAIGVKSDYTDGLALVAFLAVQFGEDVHARLLRSARLTFEEALTQETGVSFDELFQAYRVWLTQ